MPELMNITANFSAAPLKKTLQGREYLVVPISIIKPGILNGSKGRVFYPEEECAANPSIWNGMPLTLNHPTDSNGNFKSARTPDVLDSMGLGFVSNTGFNKKLITEGWFDSEVVQRRSTKLYSKLLKGRKIEVSTGLISELHPAEEGAVFNGESYELVSRKFQPDHVAVLLDDIGACSVKQGCGINNELGNDAKSEQLLALLRDRFLDGFPPEPSHSLWILDVFENRVVFHHKDKLWQLGYKVSSTDKVKLSTSMPSEVVRQVNFVTLNKKDDKPMPLSKEKRKELIAKLVVNCQCKGDADTEVLNAMSDEALEIVARRTEQEPPADPKPTPVSNSTNPTPTDGPSIKDMVRSELQNLSASEFFEYAPPEVQEVIANAKSTQDKAKKQLITNLTNHMADEDEKALAIATLNKLSVPDLENLQTTAPAQRRNSIDNPFSTADASLGSGVVNKKNNGDDSFDAVANSLALPEFALE